MPCTGIQIAGVRRSPDRGARPAHTANSLTGLLSTIILAPPLIAVLIFPSVCYPVETHLLAHGCLWQHPLLPASSVATSVATSNHTSNCSLWQSPYLLISATWANFFSVISFYNSLNLLITLSLPRALPYTRDSVPSAFVIASPEHHR